VIFRKIYRTILYENEMLQLVCISNAGRLTEMIKIPTNQLKPKSYDYLT
jgi:hypothetical protein